MNQETKALDLSGPLAASPESDRAVLPLVEELQPAPDPWDVACRMAVRPHLLFLDSASAPGPLARYSYVTAHPFTWLTARGRQVWLNGDPLSATDPFTVLSRQLRQWRTESVPGLPGFQGGAAGLFGYDLCHHLERLPRPRCDEFATPDLAIGFYDWVIAFDHQACRAWLISTGLPETDASRQRERAAKRAQ